MLSKQIWEYTDPISYLDYDMMVLEKAMRLVFVLIISFYFIFTSLFLHSEMPIKIIL